MTAADQTPAADSERVEQIRARWYEHHIDPTDRDARILLLTEVDVPWLLALIAGQAATIERVAAVHVRRAWDYDRDPVTRFKNQQFLDQCDHCRVNWPCRTAAALGSQPSGVRP